MIYFSNIFASIRAFRNLIYFQLEKEKKQRIFSELESKSQFRVFSPDFFSPECTIGSYSYIAHGTVVSDCDIGKFSSIGPNCTIGFGQHPTKWPSTSPVFTSGVKIFDSVYSDKSYYAAERERIYIGNDVWVGANVYIKNGVSIGNGAVVAAGSVVVKNIEPYDIVGGVPAKTIRKRFDINYINELQQIKWWDKDIKQLKKIQPLFVSENIEKFIEAVKKI